MLYVSDSNQAGLCFFHSFKPATMSLRAASARSSCFSSRAETSSMNSSIAASRATDVLTDMILPDAVNGVSSLTFGGMLPLYTRNLLITNCNQTDLGAPR